MARFYKKRSENKGLPSGSLVFIGQKKVEKPTIDCISYQQAELKEIRELQVDDLPLEEEGYIEWYNIFGLDHVEFMTKVQRKLNIHPLFMEDIMNTGQRAKFEQLGDTIFITLKMLQFDQEAKQVLSEQVSIVIKGSILVSFQEAPGDNFDPVRARLENPESNLRLLGPDYLAYALMDSIVDNYIYLIESLGEQIDNLELEVIEDANEETLQKINTFKRELNFVAKVIRPVRDLMSYLIRSRKDLSEDDKVLPYFKDLQDLITHAVESVETYRVVLTDYIQLYHSSMSTRMNDIMRVLTIFSAIFIPLSFFAGVYGTNFENFPELQYEYAYFIWWGVVVMIALGMLWFFKRKGWL